MFRAKRYSDLMRLCMFFWAVVGALAGSASTATAQNTGGTNPFGPNVIILDPSMSSASVNSVLNSVNQETQFSTNRHAVLFKPGNYGTTGNPVGAQVGFYEQVAGLGSDPTQVTMTGGMGVDQFIGGNMTQNFWRSMENLSERAVGGASGILDWGVSQGASLRRMNIQSNLWFANSGPINGENACQEASGGFMADSYVLGQVNACSQQQWYTRNSNLQGGFSGFVWNFVFSGVPNAPGQSYPGGASGAVNVTNVAATPISIEKPFLYLDSSGNYNVFKPQLQTSSSGTTWAPNSAGIGYSLPISTFFIATPSTSLADINNALAASENLILTPGIYQYSGSIDITQADTIVLGMGYATIVPQTGTPAITVADVDGVRIAGLLIDAGPINSPVLVEVGNPGLANVRHTSNPTSLNDVYFRIGGGTVGSATTSLQVDSSDVILDNIWAWRADHGNAGTVGWTTNRAAHGVVVNGSYVTAMGLAVEHYQQEQVLWNGDGGTTIFYQSELPYDVPNQAAWSHGSTNGYPSYAVSPGTACNHKAYGLGIYSFFNQGLSIIEDNAMTVPNSSGVSITDVGSVFLNGSGQISNIINGTGGPANSSNSGKLNPLAKYTGTGSCVLPTDGNYLPPPNSSSNYNPNNFDAANTIQEMIHPHNDLVLLMAHRGVHNTINPAIVNYVPAPENSLESIGLTATLGYEGAEVDIKLSSDGVPMLSHDTSWGREALCPGCSTGNAFNPFGPNTPANQAMNPQVGTLTEAQAKQFELYTVQKPELPVQPVPSLEDLLKYMTTNKIAMVLALDIKDIAAAQACWTIVKRNNDYLGRPYYKSVVFKVASVIWNTPADFEMSFGSDYPNVLYWPYYTTNQIAPNYYNGEPGMISSLHDWQASGINMVGTEVNIKEPDGILTDMLAAAKTYNGMYATGVGAFNPTAEYRASQGGTAEFFYGKDTSTSYSGYCCYTLQDILYDGSAAGQRSDKADDRGDIYFLLQSGINVITTDEVTTVGPILAQEGLRNTSHLQQPGTGPTAGPPGYTYCGAENSTCSFAGVAPVAFGVNGTFNYQTFTNSASCSTTVFGDPLPGVGKSCYRGNPLSYKYGSPYIYCADENGTCTFNGTANVYYGASHFILTAGADNSYVCNNSSIPAGSDPDPGVLKACFYQLNSSNNFSGPSGYVLCASENQSCPFAGSGIIAFGANGTFSYQNIQGGTPCSTAVFGDPVPGVAKSCYYRDATSGSAAVNSVPADGTYVITNVNSGLDMDVTGGSTATGTAIEQYTPNGGNGQKWKLSSIGGGKYQLISVISGLCLDVYKGAVQAGTTIDQYTCNTSFANQQFTLSPSAAGGYSIVGVQSGLAVEVPKLSTAPKTVLDIWTVNQGKNQAWTFTPTN